MSSSYLDKFRSALPTTQGNQILKRLIAQRDSGEIKSVDEFKERLKTLTAKILADRITPTLSLFEAVVGEDTSSEQYNEMLSRIEDDLEAGFAEADNLDEIIAAHHNLISEVALKALRFGINELEAKISLYEFLNKSTHGFNDALFNTFRESQNLSTARSDKAASLVFVDPREEQIILSDEDAQVDVVGERLILGADQTQILPVRQAEWLSSASSIRSELDVAFANSNISNITDNTKSTYWVEPILLSDVRRAGVPMEVALHMNASQDINFIEIEPASYFPMVVTGIDYYDGSSTRRSTEVTDTTLLGPTRINFGRITTSTLILKLRQDNYRETQFVKRIRGDNFHQAVLGESSRTVDMNAVSDDLRDLLSSSFILEDVMSLTDDSGTPKKYFEYILGLDNVRVGFSVFDERSIFVSSKKRVEKPGVVALRVSESRPEQDAGSTSTAIQEYTYPARSTAQDGKFYHGAVEYWLVVQSFTDDDYLIATDTIPLLPLGATRVHHEQLVFGATSGSASRPDISQLMFFTEADTTDVLLYRNGTLLTWGPGNDWVFIDAADARNVTTETPGAGRPMKRAIRINTSVEPLDIYTASYSPTVSNTQVIPSDSTLLKVVDLVGDQSARMATENLVVFEQTRGAHTVAYADMYLLILMRRNSADQNFSPAVEEYMLVTGSQDDQKFVGE